MPNSSTIPTTGRTQATQTLYNNVVKDAIRLLAAAGSNKTIATGAIAVTPSAGESHYQVDTQASAADDDLDSILHSLRSTWRLSAHSTLPRSACLAE